MTEITAREREEPALLRELADLLGVDESRIKHIETAARRARELGDL